MEDNESQIELAENYSNMMIPKISKYNYNDSEYGATMDRRLNARMSRITAER